MSSLNLKILNPDVHCECTIIELKNDMLMLRNTNVVFDQKVKYLCVVCSFYFFISSIYIQQFLLKYIPHPRANVIISSTFCIEIKIYLVSDGRWWAKDPRRARIEPWRRNTLLLQPSSQQPPTTGIQFNHLSQRAKFNRWALAHFRAIAVIASIYPVAT